MLITFWLEFFLLEKNDYIYTIIKNLNKHSMPKQKIYSRKNDNYQGKVEYYQGLLSNSIDGHDIDKQLFYMKKLSYFINRQKESLSK